MRVHALLDLTLAAANGNEARGKQAAYVYIFARGYLPTVIFRPRQRIDLTSADCGTS